MFHTRHVLATVTQIFHMGDDVLKRCEPDLLGLQRVFKPLFDLPPARQAAGEERMPDADPEAARLILRVELFPEGLEASDGAFTGIM